MPTDSPHARDHRRSVLVLVILVASGLLAGGCGGTTSVSTTGASTGRTATIPVHRPDPHTKRALLRIARQFNADYAANRDGAVYDRWDSRSQAVISRSEYVRRHRECPTAPGPATVEGASRAGSWWLVRYSISGIAMTDYWRYERGRWMFDLIRSNPQAVRLYRLPAEKYLQAVGCSGHQ